MGVSLMDQAKRRLYLIQSLLNENPRTAKFKIPKTQAEQEKMLRALFNTRLARPITLNHYHVPALNNYNMLVLTVFRILGSRSYF